MTLTPSRLLTRLDADIAAERDPLRADCLRAERAAYLVRQGHTEEVKAELDALHLRHDRRPNAEMSAWLSLVESLVSFFSDMGPLATDKMRRAHALSQAAGLTQLQARCAAWLAHMDYSRLDIGAMVLHVTQALQLASADLHDARSRASMVMAVGLHLAGQMSLALPWYQRARDHAVSIGDEVTTSALMHNMAWLRMHLLRQARATGEGDVIDRGHALLGLESTVQYDQLIGVSSLASLKPILRAQILALRGDAEQALALFEDHLSAQPDGMSRIQCTLLAEQAWCLVQVKEMDRALRAAKDAEASFAKETQIDDTAAAHSRLAEVFAALGEAETAERHQTLANDAWEKFSELQERLGTALGEITEFGTPK